MKYLNSCMSFKHMQWLRDTHGTVLAEPRKIVKALVHHWDDVSERYGRSKEECPRFLRKLGICPNIAQYGAALFKPLSLSIVEEGLRRLKTRGSPGIDGVPAEILKAFPEIMIPKMHACIKMFLNDRALPSDWPKGIVTMVPKSFGEPSVENLHPIALQTTRQKWITNVLLIQLEDVLA